MQEHAVQAFFRFKDDLLIIGHDRQLMMRYWRLFKQRAGYFNVLIEEVSDIGVDFLQVRVSRRGHRFEAHPKYKASKMGMPLEGESSHPRSIHRTWPITMIGGITTMSTRHEYAEIAKNTVIQRFRNFLAPDTLIAAMRNTPVWTIKARSIKDTDGDEAKIVWLPIPFHPIWKTEITRSLSKLNAKPAVQRMWGMAFGNTERVIIKVSWLNAMPSLQQILRI